MVHVIPKFILILDLGRFYREHLPPYKGVHPGLWLFILSGAMEVVGLVGLTILPSHNHKTFQVYTKDSGRQNGQRSEHLGTRRVWKWKLDLEIDLVGTKHVVYSSSRGVEHRSDGISR